jgi:hypothetical protein
MLESHSVKSGCEWLEFLEKWQIFRFHLHSAFTFTLEFMNLAVPLFFITLSGTGGVEVDIAGNVTSYSTYLAIFLYFRDLFNSVFSSFYLPFIIFDGTASDFAQGVN